MKGAETERGEHRGGIAAAGCRGYLEGGYSAGCGDIQKEIFYSLCDHLPWCVSGCGVLPIASRWQCQQCVGSTNKTKSIEVLEKAA